MLSSPARIAISLKLPHLTVFTTCIHSSCVMSPHYLGRGQSQVLGTPPCRSCSPNVCKSNCKRPTKANHCKLGTSRIWFGRCLHYLTSMCQHLVHLQMQPPRSPVRVHLQMQSPRSMA